jgi:uncharacterized glyoxalase superfamily protein PhnB
MSQSFLLNGLIECKKGLNMTQVVPILRIFDEALARAFYLDYLGFEVLFEHRFEENAPLYMGVRREHCELHLSEHFGDATPGSSVRVHEKDLAGYHDALSQKSYRHYHSSVIEQPWGSFDMTILDPFGNKLIFYQGRED